MMIRFSRDFWKVRSAGPPHFSGADLNLSDDRYSWTPNAQLSNEKVDQRKGQSEPLPQMRGDCSVFLPESYEPNYPYPLILWLHGAGGTETDLHDVMPQISTQNYLGLGLRGSQFRSTTPLGFGWPKWDRPISDFEESLHATVCRMRREYHIHSERIFPAGFGEGADMAMRLLLSRPEWFGGAIALGGRLAHNKQTLTRFRDLNQKRILIGTGTRDRSAPATNAIHAARLLHTAGMDVNTRFFDAEHELTPEMCAHVNHWIMEGICAANQIV